MECHVSIKVHCTYMYVYDLVLNKGLAVSCCIDCAFVYAKKQKHVYTCLRSAENYSTAGQVLYKQAF